ncbi:hypothetical protein [Atopococcus tabaci]|uniref:hypothetical protein n=1 Tax=Atopococcus tabaci TaxID=269774 RepID=UPI0004167D36|nr:hypothetical protein [Atopococcus tabaci]
MKDKELWHNDRSELNEDRRDDRRDQVSPEPGPLGFLVENEDQDTGDRVPNESPIGDNVSNEVETFSDRDYDNERVEDDTTTRRDEELWINDDETLTNRERENRFHRDNEDRREADRDFQVEGNPLRGSTEESPYPQEAPSDRDEGVPEDPSQRPELDPTAHAEDTERSLPKGPGSPGQRSEGISPSGSDDMSGPSNSSR